MRDLLYLNGKRNGKEKDYYEIKIIFEGEYLYNWKLKGTEFLKGRKEYEGEYLYDIKYNGKGYDEKGNILYELKNGNGKIKIYNFQGILEFEGECLNGKFNGIGKDYDEDSGDLRFEGEYLNNKRNGKGKEYNYEGKLVFEGEYLNDKRHGKGKEYNDEGELIFEGEYENGVKKASEKDMEDIFELLKQSISDN